LNHKALAAVVGVALAARLVTSLFRITYGVVPVPFVGPTPWADYNVYVSELHFVAQGYLPYRDFGFSYMPLFLYALLPFYLLLGTYGASLVIVVSDALTAGLVYSITSRRLESRLALVAGLAYALLPFALYNEGYLWLSSQPMTFFAILSLYLLLEGRPYQSFAALAISVLFKQETIVLLPVFFAWQFRISLVRALRGFVVFVTMVLAASVPFLIATADNYLYAISYTLVKLGPLTSYAVSAYPTGSASLPSKLTCANSVIPGQFTGQVCSAMNVLSLSWVVTQPVAYRVAASFEGFLALLVPVFVLLLGVSLYSIRRSDNFLQLTSAASAVGILVVFGFLVHGVLAYYFVPVYALALSASTDRTSAGVAIAGSVLSFLVPEGVFQTLLPIGILAALVVIEDHRLSKGGTGVGPSSLETLRGEGGQGGQAIRALGDRSDVRMVRRKRLVVPLRLSGRLLEGVAWLRVQHVRGEGECCDVDEQRPGLLSASGTEPSHGQVRQQLAVKERRVHGVDEGSRCDSRVHLCDRARAERARGVIPRDPEGAPEEGVPVAKRLPYISGSRSSGRESVRRLQLGQAPFSAEVPLSL
jgi:hypothetical protein